MTGDSRALAPVVQAPVELTGCTSRIASSISFPLDLGVSEFERNARHMLGQTIVAQNASSTPPQPSDDSANWLPNRWLTYRCLHVAPSAPSRLLRQQRWYSPLALIRATAITSKRLLGCLPDVTKLLSAKALGARADADCRLTRFLGPRKFHQRSEVLKLKERKKHERFGCLSKQAGSLTVWKSVSAMRDSQLQIRPAGPFAW